MKIGKIAIFGTLVAANAHAQREPRHLFDPWTDLAAPGRSAPLAIEGPVPARRALWEAYGEWLKISDEFNDLSLRSEACSPLEKDVLETLARKSQDRSDAFAGLCLKGNIDGTSCRDESQRLTEARHALEAVQSALEACIGPRPSRLGAPETTRFDLELGGRFEKRASEVPEEGRSRYGGRLKLDAVLRGSSLQPYLRGDGAGTKDETGTLVDYDVEGGLLKAGKQFQFLLAGLASRHSELYTAGATEPEELRSLGGMAALRYGGSSTSVELRYTYQNQTTSLDAYSGMRQDLRLIWNEQLLLDGVLFSALPTSLSPGWRRLRAALVLSRGPRWIVSAGGAESQSDSGLSRLDPSLEAEFVSPRFRGGFWGAASALGDSRFEGRLKAHLGPENNPWSVGALSFAIEPELKWIWGSFTVPLRLGYTMRHHRGGPGADINEQILAAELTPEWAFGRGWRLRGRLGYRKSWLPDGSLSAAPAGLWIEGFGLRSLYAGLGLAYVYE